MAPHPTCEIPEIFSLFFFIFFCRGGAFPTTAIAPTEKCIVDDERRIAVCGDFCVSPRVEGAILSGLAAAHRLAHLL